MKIFWILWSALFSTSFFPQSNSVLLKDMTGQLISSCSSLLEAYISLPDSITQSYLIEIQTSYRGTDENFPVTLGRVTGSSKENQIIIKPAGEVRISADVPNNAVIEFNGCSFVTIDGRVENSDTLNSLLIENLFELGPTTHTILFTGDTKNITIKYCNLAGHTQYEYWGPGVIQLRSYNWTENPHYITIENCKINGGSRGIYLDGFELSSNYIIKNCIIEDFAADGIFLNDAKSVRVIDNIIRQNVIYDLRSWGIFITGGDTVYITGNKILNLQSIAGPVAGIYVIIPLSVVHINIVNNFISLYAENPDVKNVYGITFGGTDWWGSYTAHIVYQNTVFISGEYTGSADSVRSACFYKSSPATSARFFVENNIFINMRHGGNQNAVHSGSIHKNMFGDALVYNHNIYFASEFPNCYCAAWDTIYYNNIDEYKSAASPEESNTLFRNVDFAATDDLHLTSASWKDPELKAPLTLYEYRKDIDGEQRTYTYKGADELTELTDYEEGWNKFKNEFILHPNYPNPFNSATIISYYLPKDERVTIKLYNTLGQEIKTLLDEFQTSGTRNFRFNAHSLSSGVYLIQVISGSNHFLQKVVLIK